RWWCSRWWAGCAPGWATAASPTSRGSARRRSSCASARPACARATRTTSPSRRKPRTTRSADADSEMSGRPRLLVLFASLLVSSFIALSVPLFAPDEVRNAEVAREMAADGDWLVPHLAGMPYLDKPPAFFWAAALSIRVLGHTPFAARVPAMIAGLLTLWLVGRAAAPAGRAAAGWIAPALLAAAPLFAGLSAYVIFDMPLALCVTAVWLGVAREVADGASAAARLAMFGAIALGILTK